MYSARLTVRCAFSQQTYVPGMIALIQQTRGVEEVRVSSRKRSQPAPATDKQLAARSGALKLV